MQQSVTPQWQGQAPRPGGRLESGKKTDWALVRQQGPQPQTTDVNTTYAGMVEAMRDLVGHVEREGMSPELEDALHQQGFRVVCCLPQPTTTSATASFATFV